MTVDAVQNNKMSYIGAMTIGAVTGYSLKWAIPITSEEKNDGNYSAKLSEIRKKAQKAKEKEVETIKKEAAGIPYGDEFVKMTENNQLDYSKIKDLKGTKQEALMNLFERINDAAKNISHDGIKELNAKTKALRSTGTFISLGILTGLLIAAVGNIIKTPSKN
jgi:hypothetical protein